MTMYPIVRAVVQRLAADAGVSGAVSARIFPEARAQDGTLPCIVVSLTQEETSGALVASATTLRKAEVELAIVAATAKQCSEIAEVIYASLHGAAGWTYSTAGAGATSIRVLHSLHSKSLTNYQPPSAGEATGAYLHSSIYSILYQEDN